MMFVTLFIGVSLLIMTKNLGLGVSLPIILVITGGNIFSSVISVLLNDNIDSAYRATTLSAATFLSKIVFIILTALSGLLIEKGALNDVTILLSMLALSPLLLQLVTRPLKSIKKIILNFCNGIFLI